MKSDMYEMCGFVELDDYSEEVCTWLARQSGVSREEYIRDLLCREEKSCEDSNKEMTIDSLHKRMNFLFSLLNERLDILFDSIECLKYQLTGDDEE